MVGSWPFLFNFIVSEREAHARPRCSSSPSLSLYVLALGVPTVYWATVCCTSMHPSYLRSPVAAARASISRTSRAVTPLLFSLPCVLSALVFWYGPLFEKCRMSYIRCFLLTVYTAVLVYLFGTVETGRRPVHRMFEYVKIPYIVCRIPYTVVPYYWGCVA